MARLIGGTYTRRKKGKKTRQGLGRGSKFSTKTKSKRFKKKYRGQGK
jgi:hypothetical protein|tara:strand:- start:419 stop:559 length:141 start_codon:yes stop_codon:yes gene_type:complete